MENDLTCEKPEELSRYTGGAVVRKLMSFVAFFVSLITLSLANPAMVCWKQRYECKHTYIDGKRLVFDGKGIQLFGKFICWVLLSIITFGIYLFWLSVKKQKWITKHTHFYVEGQSSSNEDQPAVRELTEEEREKLLSKKRQAHNMGTVALILTFIVPQFGLIFSILGIVYGSLYREKHGLRLSVIAISVILTAITVVLSFILKDLQQTFIIIAVTVGIIALTVCITVFVITKNWESVSVKTQK